MAVLAVHRHPIYLAALSEGTPLTRLVLCVDIHNDYRSEGGHLILYSATSVFSQHTLLREAVLDWIFLLLQLPVGGGPSDPLFGHLATVLNDHSEHKEGQVELHTNNWVTAKAISNAPNVSSGLPISMLRNCGCRSTVMKKTAYLRCSVT